MSERTRDDDWNERGIVGLCCWCGEPILESEEYEEGDDGGGWAHVECRKVEEDGE